MINKERKGDYLGKTVQVFLTSNQKFHMVLLRIETT